MNTLTRSVLRMALTAGAVYLFDPVSGRRRRLLLVDQCLQAAHRLNNAKDRARQDLTHEAHDLATQSKARFTPDQPSDRKLAARLRDVVGRAVSHPEAIDVAVQGNRVILRGDVFAHELDHLLEVIRSMHGVRVVTDRLRARARAEDIHSVRGASANGSPSIASRIFLGVTACGLLVWGVKERKTLGAWGEKIWQASRREIDEGLAHVQIPGDTAEPAVAGAVIDNGVTHQTVADAAEEAVAGYTKTRRKKRSGLAADASK